MNKTDLEQSFSAIVIIICDMKPLLYPGLQAHCFTTPKALKALSWSSLYSDTLHYRILQ